MNHLLYTINLPDNFKLRNCLVKVIFTFTYFFPIWIQAQEVSTEWAKHIGGSSNDYSFSVTTDLKGNVYYTGYFGGTVDFDPGVNQMMLTAKGIQDIFILKLNSDGQFLWVKQIGDASNRVENMGRCVKTDNFGNVYIAGLFTGSPDFNPGNGTNILSTNSSSDGFLLKMDSLGNYLWAVNIGSVLTQGITSRKSDKRTYGIALRDAHVYITGSANDDLYISQLDTSGNFIWTKSVGGNRANYSYSLAVDKIGDVYATGMISSDSIDFDPGPGKHVLYNSTMGFMQNSYDIFIWKLDKYGNFIWAKTIGNSGLMDKAEGIAIDEVGDVYIGGSFVASVDFNPGGTPFILTSNSSSNSYSPFVAKYSSAGHLIWAHIIGETIINRTPVIIPNWSYDLTLDDKNNVYSIGRFTGTLDFDPGSATSDTFFLQSKGNNNIFISKLDSSGKFMWAKRFVESGFGSGYGIHLDNLNNVYATGSFTGDISFDSAQNLNFTSFGVNDMFLAKLNQFCSSFSDSTVFVSICEDEYLFNSRKLIHSGIFTDTLTDTKGCDSIITVDLVLKGKLEPPIINVNVFELSTVLSYSTYQWYFNGSPLVGETNRTLHVDKNGNYTVAVTSENGCTDTSDIYKVTNVTGIQNERSLVQIDIFPNPVRDIIYIRSDIKVNALLSYIDGRQLKSIENVREISTQELSSGLYLLKIFDEKGNLIRVEKIIIL